MPARVGTLVTAGKAGNSKGRGSVKRGITRREARRSCGRHRGWRPGVGVVCCAGSAWRRSQRCRVCLTRFCISVPIVIQGARLLPLQEEGASYFKSGAHVPGNSLGTCASRL